MTSGETIITVTKFVFHEVDRDPESRYVFFPLRHFSSNIKRSFFLRLYGGNRILTEEHGDMDIVEIKFEEKYDIVIACEIYDKKAKKVFRIPKNAKSDEALFISSIVNRWEILKSNYIDDENYTDYLPAWYQDLAEVVAGKLKIII